MIGNSGFSKRIFGRLIQNQRFAVNLHRFSTLNKICLQFESVSNENIRRCNMIPSAIQLTSMSVNVRGSNLSNMNYYIMSRPKLTEKYCYELFI